MYFAAPPDTPKITGDLASSHTSRMFFAHSKLFTLNCATAYPSALALSNISFAFTNAILILLYLFLFIIPKKALEGFKNLVNN
jgi:hypothetical protein